MTLYHGSNVEVPTPKILVPSHALDFGPGFYTTLFRGQAEDFARKSGRWASFATKGRRSSMSERQYSTMLALLILPPLVALIAERMGIDESSATGKLYHSEFYEKLSDERLKLWHYSPVMLAEMFVEADRTGVIPYPEEA